MALKREQIYIDGEDKTHSISSYSYQDDKCVIFYNNSNKPYPYNKSKVKIVPTAISEDKPFSVFEYLKRIAEAIGLTTEEGHNILAKSYENISVIPTSCVLANYLNGRISKPNESPQSVTIFPFGFNLSQKEAVNKASSSKISVIEGPPGTGKTQTILNIIANAVINGQSVAVVSSNNSATKNVYEKLDKNGLGFISAVLGSSQNKKDFIESQESIPNLSEFNLSTEKKKKLEKKAKTFLEQLSEYLSKKNELALVKQEIDNVKTERQHFRNAHKEKIIRSFRFKENITSDDLLTLWLTVEKQADKGSKFAFFARFLFWIKYGIKDKSFYEYSFEDMIFICQSMYYNVKSFELIKKREILDASLKEFSFDAKMKEYTKLSMLILKSTLYKKYTKKKRESYSVDDLRRKSSDFIEDYPVVMSTTYSLRRSLSENISYDYVIIDESSQVDLATGALALSCAKRAVVVGDLKQLPNVVDSTNKIKTDSIFSSFRLHELYRYSSNSLLSSIMKLFPDIPKTLLKEHYRCHPKIIEFCNKKFYDNQLIVHTEQTETGRSPLIVYKTPPGNHARERMNQRQIDIIKQEIIPNEKLENVDLGIVTPYRNQTDALQNAFSGTTIKADTVDKFQGRENHVIILSTVDNEISDFADNPNRLNVAVSRAIEQLILVVNGNESEKDNNVADLIKYIEYNNFSVIQCELNSIFDCLYKGYEEKRKQIISKSRRVSDFDSENLMYALIHDVLSQEDFSKYDVLLHFSLRNLIRDYSRLNEQERKYAHHPSTHLDFLIYNKLSKTPLLAIEVDGYEYHKHGTRQAERDKMKDIILEKYGLPLIRFATNGSNEKRILLDKLHELQK